MLLLQIWLMWKALLTVWRRPNILENPVFSVDFYDNCFLCYWLLILCLTLTWCIQYNYFSYSYCFIYETLFYIWNFIMYFNICQQFFRIFFIFTKRIPIRNNVESQQIKKSSQTDLYNNQKNSSCASYTSSYFYVFQFLIFR